MPKRKKTIFSSKEVSHILDCTPDDVILLANKGKLNGRKKGKFWEFRLKVVEAYRKKLAKEEGRQGSA